MGRVRAGALSSGASARPVLATKPGTLLPAVGGRRGTLGIRRSATTDDRNGFALDADSTIRKVGVAVDVCRSACGRDSGCATCCEAYGEEAN